MEMTNGEKMVWAAAFAGELRYHHFRGIRSIGKEKAVFVASHNATKVVEFLREHCENNHDDTAAKEMTK